MRRYHLLAVLTIAMAWAPALAQSPMHELEALIAAASRPSGNYVDHAPLLCIDTIVRGTKDPEQRRQIEKCLDNLLLSDAALPAKEYAGRILWRIGTAESAPALKRLLTSERTVAIACYAIGSNPIPEFDVALREALPRSSSNAAISIINLLGQRRDAVAIPLLGLALKNKDVRVVSAAAVALGKIGTLTSVEVLGSLRSGTSREMLPIIEESYLQAIDTVPRGQAAPLLAELVADRQPVMMRRAALIRLSAVKPQVVLPLLLAILQGKEDQLFPAAGAALWNLPESHSPLILEALPQLSLQSQVIVIEAMGSSIGEDRLVQLACTAQQDVRLAAIHALARRGGAKAVDAALRAAAGAAAPEQRSAILETLVDMPGDDTSRALLAGASSASGDLFLDLVRILAQRNARVPVELAIRQVNSPDASARLAGARALRLIASPADASQLLALLANSDEAPVRRELEATIAAAARVQGAADKVADMLIGELKAATRPADRQAMLNLLGQTGTAAALQAMRGALQSSSEADREAAFATLVNWPNDLALPDLMQLAASGEGSRQRLAFRAAVNVLRLPSQRPAEQTVKSFESLAALARDAGDRKSILGGLADVVDQRALQASVAFLNDPDVVNEACLAAVSIAKKLATRSEDDAKAVVPAMRAVAKAAKDPSIRGQANKLAQGGSANTPPQAKDEPGFVALFDGKTLAGWEGNLQAFRIENGAIVGGTLKEKIPRNEFLTTAKEFGDFELRLKFKLVGKDCNGGVQIRSRRIPNHHEMIGYQADLGQQYWGCLYDESRRKKVLAGPDKIALDKVLRRDDWNEYRIRCQGKRITLWINGLQTVDYTEPDDAIEQKGLIGLQIHSGAPSEAWYKDIRIKELPPQ